MFRGGYPHLYDASTPNDIYFHDNGLLNYLLGIHSAEELLNGPKRGDVFENLIISQTVKRYLNKNKDGELYFYRDTNQSEIGLVDATQRRSPTLIEIKSRMTPRPDFFRHLATVEEELGVPVDRRIVVYRGTENFTGKKEACYGGALFGAVNQRRSSAHLIGGDSPSRFVTPLGGSIVYSYVGSPSITNDTSVRFTAQPASGGANSADSRRRAASCDSRPPDSACAQALRYITGARAGPSVERW